MTLRLITIATLIAFLNTTLGCTKIAVRPTEDMLKHPDKRIHAAALYSSYPFKIDLKDVDRVRFTGTNRGGENDPVANTVPAATFKKQAARYKVIKIEAVVLKSGEEINLENRKSRYEAWADVITVTGDEIIFDNYGGCMNPGENIIRGRTLSGDSVAVKVEDIAYIRRWVPDYVITSLFIGSLIASVVLVSTGLISLTADN